MNLDEERFLTTEEEYHEEIWGTFENFLYKRGTPTSKLHLPEEGHRPYCHEMMNNEYEFTEKSVEAYPPGWREICKVCLTVWNENND